MSSEYYYASEQNPGELADHMLQAAFKAICDSSRLGCTIQSLAWHRRCNSIFRLGFQRQNSPWPLPL